MGSIGNKGTTIQSRYPALPENPTYFRLKEDGDTTYYMVDKNATPEDGWEFHMPELYRGYRIEPFYDTHTYYATGRSGSTKYYVIRTGDETIKYLHTLKEAKEYLEGRKWEA